MRHAPDKEPRQITRALNRGNGRPPRDRWEEEARRIVRAAMERGLTTYGDLVQRLAIQGVADNERNVRNKIASGRFSAAFLLQCLRALGVGAIRIE